MSSSFTAFGDLYDRVALLTIALNSLSTRVNALDGQGPSVPPNPVRNITFGTVTGTTCVVNWEKPTEPNPGSKLFNSAYVYILTTNTPPTPSINDHSAFQIGESVPQTYTFTSLTVNTPYYVFIYAYGPGGFSTVTSHSFTTSSTAPPNTPTSLTVTVTDPISFTLSWTHTDSSSIEYRIFTKLQGQTAPGWDDSGYQTSTTTSTNITNLDYNTAYVFYVFAVSSTNGASLAGSISHSTATETPSGLMCETAIFNPSTNTWDITSTAGVPPTPSRQCDNYILNYSTCQYDNTSTEDTNPGSNDGTESSWIFNSSSCTWENNGSGV